MRNKLLIGVLSLILVACTGSGGLLRPSPAPALQGITGVDALMGATCPTNWSRIAPHICGRTVRGADTNLVIDNTCRSLDLNAAYGVSTASQYALIQATHGNTNFTNFYSDNACANIFATQFTATAAQNSGQVAVRLINGVLWYRSVPGITAFVNPILFYD